MKVYRIKHKPSGWYLNKYSGHLTKCGSVFESEKKVRQYLSLVTNGAFLAFTKGNGDFEIKEYILED